MEKDGDKSRNTASRAKAGKIARKSGVAEAFFKDVAWKIEGVVAPVVISGVEFEHFDIEAEIEGSEFLAAVSKETGARIKDVEVKSRKIGGSGSARTVLEIAASDTSEAGEGQREYRDELRGIEREWTEGSKGNGALILERGRSDQLLATAFTYLE